MGLFTTEVAYAASERFNEFVRNVDRIIINPLILLLFALAIVYFLWGLFEFLSNAENEEKRTAGKSHMLWGAIGLAIMMGVFLMLNVVLNTLNISNTEINPETGKVDLKPYTPSKPYVDFTP